MLRPPSSRSSASAATRDALPISARQIADGAGYFLLILVVLFFGWLFFSSGWTPEERKRLYAIGVLFLAAAFFWSVFEQAGSTLNLFADRDTSNVVLGYEFPSSWFQSMNSLFIIALAPVFAWLWVRLANSGIEPSSPAKFALRSGLRRRSASPFSSPQRRLSAAGTKVSPMWLTMTYLLHTIGELCLSPVGLSAMTKLAPVRIAGLMMGVWFLATSVGNFIGGRRRRFLRVHAAADALRCGGGIRRSSLDLFCSRIVRPMKRLMGEADWRRDDLRQDH